MVYSPGFQRPASVVTSNDPDGAGFAWTDRTHQGPAEPGANLVELLAAKPELDRRVVILPAGHSLDVRFQNPIVDAPGPDIILAGWIGSPMVEVIGTPSSTVPLANSAELRDTWGRIILGYDLAALPKTGVIDTVRIIGTHGNGPHQGFELHEVRARQ